MTGVKIIERGVAVLAAVAGRNGSVLLRLSRR